MSAFLHAFWPAFVLSFAAGFGVTVWFRCRKASRAATAAVDDFARMAGGILARSGRIFHYAPERDTFTEIVADGQSPDDTTTLYLGNLRKRTGEMGRRDREAFLQSFIGSALDAPEIGPDDRADLRPRLRMAAEMSIRRIHAGAELRTVTRREGAWTVEIVLNRAVSLAMLTPAQLPALGLGEAEAFDAARRNLLADTPPTPGIWERLSGHVWILRFQDDYDGARLVLLGDAMAKPEGCEAVSLALFPTHGHCLVTDSRAPAVVAEALELAAPFTEAHRPLSSAVWVETPQGWQVFDPPAGACPPANRAAAIERILSANDQRDSLLQLFERNASDLFPAQLMAFEGERAGDLMTGAVFIGAGTLLPRADCILMPELVDGEPQAHKYVAWEDFGRIMDVSRTPVFALHGVPLEPARWHFKSDPTPAQRASLTAAARAWPNTGPDRGDTRS